MKYTLGLEIVFAAAVAAFSPSPMNLRRSKSRSPLRHPFGVQQNGSTSHLRYLTVLNMAGEKIGVFFGTSTGSTQTVAERIVAEFGSDVVAGPIEIDSIQGKVADEFAKYDALVVGTPTWNTGADTERSGTGWDEVYYSEMQDLNIAGKKVAVFGLGDSVSYAENYADASGELHDVFESLGCKMMGYVSQEGYEHETSKAIRGDLFCGLLLDEVNQEELTEDRVKNWVSQLISEGILDDQSVEADPPVSPAPVVDVFPPVVDVPATSDASQVIAKLEEENAMLRNMMEENSRLLDESIAAHGSESDGYVPHYNPKTGRTMWTSPDGRSCYFTVDTPKTTSFSP